MRFMIILLVLFQVTTNLIAQDLNQFEKKEFASPSGQPLPYRILYPENYDRTNKYPLVLFLHGAGERGERQ